MNLGGGEGWEVRGGDWSRGREYIGKLIEVRQSATRAASPQGPEQGARMLIKGIETRG